MRFTWLTYRVAQRRSFRREYQAFSDHQSALRGSSEWVKELRLGRLLAARKRRERGR